VPRRDEEVRPEVRSHHHLLSGVRQRSELSEQRELRHRLPRWGLSHRLRLRVLDGRGAGVPSRSGPVRGPEVVLADRTVPAGFRLRVLSTRF